MKIDSIEFWIKKFELKEPYTIAYETVSHCENVFLKINSYDGYSGWGCACPDPYITGESGFQIIEKLKTFVVPILDKREVYELPLILEELRVAIGPARSTIALVDMAMHDLICRKFDIPLYKYLGVYRHSIPTSITLGICSLEDTLEKAKSFLRQGFFILKLKGGLELNEDLLKIKKLREKLGFEFILRFDANQGYTAEEAILFVARSENLKVEIFEQPCDKDSFEDLRKITANTRTPIMADESLFNLADAFSLASNEVTDMINIKLMKVGGIIEANHINSVGKSAGLETMVGCLDESALGISAGLHFALSKKNIHFADLDGHLDLVDDPFDSIIILKKGILFPTSSPGLGAININKL
jgi:L-alanine-DL-glutamate epimerase-like enolase superfamily enzyme